MKSYEYIALLGTLTWMTVPFFQFKSKHFIFFILIGLNDFIGLIFYYSSISSQSLWIPILYLTVLGLEKDFFIKNLKWIFSGLILVFMLNHYSSPLIQHLFSLLTSTIILIVFTWYFYMDYINNIISKYYIILSIYGLFSVYQSTLLISKVELDLNIYFVAMTIKILIGVILIFIKKDYQFSTKG